MGWRRSAQAIAVVLLGGVVSCARTLPLTDQDLCGLEAMELHGVTLVRTRSKGVNTGILGGGTVVTSSSSRGRQVSCTPPPEDNDRICRVTAYRARAIFKRRNGSATHEGRQELLNQSVALWRSTYRECMVAADEDPDADDEEQQ